MSTVSQTSPPATPDTTLTPEVLAVLDALATRILADLAAMLADLARANAAAPEPAPAPAPRRCGRHAARHGRPEVTR